MSSTRSGPANTVRVFSRYQYPSALPRHVQTRMIDATRKVLTQFGYDCAPFNIEFYWDRRTDGIRLLEVNSRISKSHCPLFRMVDGASHQEVMVDLALGQQPEFPHRQGDYGVAAKFMHRVFRDGIVRGMPSLEERRRVQSIYPEARFRLLVSEGERLRDSRFIGTATVTSSRTFSWAGRTGKTCFRNSIMYCRR